LTIQLCALRRELDKLPANHVELSRIVDVANDSVTRLIQGCRAKIVMEVRLLVSTNKELVGKEGWKDSSPASTSSGSCC